MKKVLHELILDVSRSELMSVIDDETGDFDITIFWMGEYVDINIPEYVRLIVDHSSSKQTDYVGNPHWPICSEKFVNLILPFARDDIQLFDAPLYDHETGERVKGFYVMNVIRKIPSLDLNRSSVSYSKDGSRIMGINTFIFNAEAVPDNVHIFRPAEWIPAIMFSDQLAKSLIGKGLTGLAFIKCRT